MHEARKPGKPMNGKTIRQSDIKRLQEFYWKKYRVRITRREAERILLEEMRDRGPYDFHKTPPPPPKARNLSQNQSLNLNLNPEADRILLENKQRG